MVQAGSRAGQYLARLFNVGILPLQGFYTFGVVCISEVCGQIALAHETTKFSAHKPNHVVVPREPVCGRIFLIGCHL